MKKEGRIIMELNRRTLRHSILTSRKKLKDEQTELAEKKMPKAVDSRKHGIQVQALGLHVQTAVQAENVGEVLLFQRQIARQSRRIPQSHHSHTRHYPTGRN